MLDARRSTTTTMTLSADEEFDICCVILVLLLAVYHNSLRQRNYLHRQAIVTTSTSPWKKLLDDGDSSSFLLLTGLDRRAFYSLLDVVIPPNHRLRHHRRRKGRQWSLSAEGQLGLLLFYLGSTMSYKHLCLIFGITPSACSRIINRMLVRVVNRLRFHPHARVKFPNEEKMQQFASMVELREPSVTDVIGFMDGVSMTSECTNERITQNAYYCGYSCDTMVNNIIAYGPDGKVFFCAINYPGSWADGSLTARFLHHIKTRIGTYKICVDQGFPRSGEASGILVGPIPERSARRLHRAVRDQLLRISNVYTSLRQASEWGMRGLQGSFPRCKKRLPTNNLQRRQILESIILIHNFRTEMVGYSQIQSVFDPEYERSITLEGYDRIANYYLQPGDYVTDDEVDGDDNGNDTDDNN
jgi:hypothetical protein